MATMQMKRKASGEECERKKQKTGLSVGETLNCQENKYEVVKFIARGGFGQVYQCKLGDKEVALKYIDRGHGAYEEREVKFLEKIRRFSEDFHLLRLHQAFVQDSHLCIVLEYLDISLHRYLKVEEDLPVPVIRVILAQLLSAVNKLKECNILHCDIKPDNIMLVDRLNKPYCIKLVDFGCALELEDFKGTVLGQVCQTRWYRAPEVILGLPCSEKMDMWSVGCVAAECLLVGPLYPGLSEYNMLEMMIETQGKFPKSMLTAATKVQTFFRQESDGWELKTPVEARRTPQASIFNDLQELTEMVHSNLEEEKEDVQQLIFLIKAMLEFDQHDRVSARHALQFPFINLSHLENSDYHRRSLAMMECTRASRRPFAPLQVN